MSEKRLTQELKNYYMQDFNDNVLSCTDNFWKIDDRLKNLLIKINKNKNVQTLYSRRRNDANDSNVGSFLWIHIAPNVSDDKLNKFIRECKANISMFAIDFFEHKHLVQNLDMSVKMNCVNDKKYYKNGAIIIEMISPEQFEHDKFWNIVEKHLPNF
jgi:hypothetical protein